MIKSAFNTVLYEPLYNGFIFLIDTFPFLDAGMAVIVFTCIIKLILFPLSKKSIRTQLAMRKLEPQMQEIRNKYKDRQEQALKLMQVYKDNKLNPFSGFFLVLIQIPILLALYWVFWRGGLPHINADILYSFVEVPSRINMKFLNLVDITNKNAVLAFLAALAQYFQIRLTLPKQQPSLPGQKEEMAQQMAKMMQTQMKYVFPVIIFIISYQYSAVLALYFVTSSLFAIGQELYLKRHLEVKGV